MRKKIMSIVVCCVMLISLLPQTVVFALSDGVYTYSVSDNSVTVIGVIDKSSFSGNQVIPYSINGYIVTGIGENAFKDCVSLESITIPARVNSIDETAFDGCHNLKIIGYTESCAESFATDMQISFEQVVRVESLNFDVTSVSLNIGDSYSIATSISPDDAVYKKLIWGTNDEGVVSVDENGTVTTVGKGITQIFAWTEDLMSPMASCDVYVEAIAAGHCGDYAEDYTKYSWIMDLENCLIIKLDGRMCDYRTFVNPWENYKDDIEKVIVSEGTKNIGGAAFKGFTSLKEIEIANSVAEIGDYAFANCSSLTNITLPDSITEITYDVFRNCSGLTSITIPKSVTSIKHYAFSNCTSLTDIYYEGTVEDWNNIEVKYGNDSLLNATVHCSDESIVSVMGISLDKNQLELNIEERVTLQYSVLPENATNKNVLWSSSNVSVAIVENGVITATGVGDATITATTEDGGYKETCEVTVLPLYSYGQTVQIGLIEPWFLKANARVYTDEHPTNIDYSGLIDYGAYFIRKSELSDTSATQASVTVEDIINDANAVKYSKAAGTATVDGSYITATYDKGLYTYELDDSVFVLFYVQDGAGIQYAPIRERNLKSLCETRMNDAVTFPNELERSVYGAMLAMYNATKAYRDDYYANN